MAEQRAQVRVLLVEDHQDSCAIICKLLRITGHDVLSAGTTQAALALAKDRRFELLVCDIELPDGPGTELLRQIRKLYPIKAIAISGHAHDNHREQFLTAGFDRFVPKPFTWQRLSSTIEELRINTNLLAPSQPDLSTFGE